MKSLFYGIVLAFCICAHLRAEKLTATICDETNSPIEGVDVSLRSSRGNKIVATTLTAHNGSFVLHDVQAGKYTLLCTHVGYSDYSANVQIVKDQDLALGTLIMFTESVEINEVIVSASRNVFTPNRSLENDKKLFSNDRH